MRSSPARSMKRPHWFSTSTARVYATSMDFIRERVNCPWTASGSLSIRYPHCLIQRYLKLPALRLRSVSAQSTSSARLETCPKAITLPGSISRAPLSPAFSSATPLLLKPPCILFFHRRVPLVTGRAPALVAVHSLSPATRPASYALFWNRTQDVHVVLQYDGAADLDLTDIVLYRETFDHR